MQVQTQRKGPIRRIVGVAGGTAGLVFGFASFALQALPWLMLSDDNAAGRAFGHFFGFLFGGGAGFMAVAGIVAGVVALAAAKRAAKFVAIAGIAVSLLAGSSTLRLLDRIS